MWNIALILINAKDEKSCCDRKEEVCSIRATIEIITSEYYRNSMVHLRFR